MKKPDVAPVALFIFNRPTLTARVFDRIRAARPRRLFLIADGPRPEHRDDAGLCEAARAVVSSIDWPCEVSTNFAHTNLGCRRRLSSGLDWVFSQTPEAIVLEDDCIPADSFFTFCTAMLERYRHDTRIMHIGGSNFMDGRDTGSASYYFSRYTLSWGWASWRRAWSCYDVDMVRWPLAERGQLLRRVLDDPLERHYWNDVFARTYRGEIDTWDYQWTFACWMRGGLSIVPRQNLVTNVGVGPDALHFKTPHSTTGVPLSEMTITEYPAVVVRHAQADRYVFDTHIVGWERRRNWTWTGRLRTRLAVRKHLAFTRLRELTAAIGLRGICGLLAAPEMQDVAVIRAELLPSDALVAYMMSVGVP